MIQLEIHGARGSYPIFDERCRRYGGNTSCYSIETPDELFIIDAGTGLTRLGEQLWQRPALPPITLLLTHVHLDHVMGLPSFKPLRRKDARITIMLEPSHAMQWRQTATTLVSKPLWPVELFQFGAAVQFDELPSGPLVRHDLTIYRCAIAHPQGGISYRFEMPERTLVLATDREQGDSPLMDRAFLEFCRGADVLLHDAQYTPEEYPTYRGWGHSTWEQSAALAKEAAAKHLVLVSHDPSRSDDELDQIVARAKRVFPNTIAAAERLVV